MNAEVRSGLIATSMILAFAAACSPKITGNGCQATCPIGCDISADCTSCIPESTQAGVGHGVHRQLRLLHRKLRQGGVCIATGLTGLVVSGSGGSNSGSTGGSGATTSRSGSGGSSTSGTPATCPTPPSIASDQACGNTSEWVCNASGQCVPNCNYDPSYCGTAVTCEINGHCQTPTSSSSSGGTGNRTGGGSGGGTSGGTTDRQGEQLRLVVEHLGRRQQLGGSSSGGSSSGGVGVAVARARSTPRARRTPDCACPNTCVAVPSSGASVSICLTPCTSYQTCTLDQICDTYAAHARRATRTTARSRGVLARARTTPAAA